MFEATPRHSMLAAALLAAVAPLAFVAPVRAQDNPVRERIEAAKRAAQEKKNKGAPAQAAQPAKYPQATRQEPAAKATARSTPTLQKIVDAYNASDAATVTTLADSVIADPKSNDYDRSFAARMVGVAVLQSDPAKAAQYLKQALQYNGLGNDDHYESMMVLAQLQMQADQYADATATLDRFITETRSQDPEALALKGNALYRLKRYPEAAAALKQAIAGAKEPHADWMQLLMGTYFDSNQPAEAVRVADELSAKNPDDKSLQMNLASVYMEAGNQDKAIAILEKLRTGGKLSDEKDYRNLYALYFNAKGKEQQGIDVINDGLQKGILKPDYETWSALAQGYYFTNQPAKAIEAYRKAAPLAPDGEAYLNLAKVLSNEGHKAEAKEAAQQALAKGVKNPSEARRLLGQKKGK